MPSIARRPSSPSGSLRRFASSELYHSSNSKRIPCLSAMSLMSAIPLGFPHVRKTVVLGSIRSRSPDSETPLGRIGRTVACSKAVAWVVSSPCPDSPARSSSSFNGIPKTRRTRLFARPFPRSGFSRILLRRPADRRHVDEVQLPGQHDGGEFVVIAELEVTAVAVKERIPDIAGAASSGVVVELFDRRGERREAAPRPDHHHVPEPGCPLLEREVPGDPVEIADRPVAGRVHLKERLAQSAGLSPVVGLKEDVELQVAAQAGLEWSGCNGIGVTDRAASLPAALVQVGNVLDLAVLADDSSSSAGSPPCGERCTALPGRAETRCPPPARDGRC